MNASITRLVVYLAPVGVLLCGAAGMWVLIAQRQPAPREALDPTGVPVEVAVARQVDRRVVIQGHGSVQPRYAVSMEPQVEGRVVWVHPELAAGAAFHQGDVLARIDPTDFELAVRQAEATLARAQVAEEKEQANAEIARAEWEAVVARLDGQTGELGVPSPLVLREPQLREAGANVAAAEAALALSRLDLERTAIRAPFDCRVSGQSISVGKLIGPGTSIAELFATDRLEVEVGLPQADLAWFEIPGAPALVTLDLGESRHHWRGTVVRQVGVLDDVGRLARVIIELPHPYSGAAPGRPLLSLGSFVAVEMEGLLLRDVIRIPRPVLRADNKVWVANAAGQLEIRSVTVARLGDDDAFIGSGLEPGEQVVLTHLQGATPGLLLQPLEVDESS